MIDVQIHFQQTALWVLKSFFDESVCDSVLFVDDLSVKLIVFLLYLDEASLLDLVRVLSSFDGLH